MHFPVLVLSYCIIAHISASVNALPPDSSMHGICLYCHFNLLASVPFRAHSKPHAPTSDLRVGRLRSTLSNRAFFSLQNGCLCLDCVTEVRSAKAAILRLSPQFFPDSQCRPVQIWPGRCHVITSRDRRCQSDDRSISANTKWLWSIRLEMPELRFVYGSSWGVKQ